MSKSAGTTKSTSTTGLPAMQLPYVESLFQRAAGQVETPPTFYPGYTVAPLTGPEITGAQYLQQQAPKMAWGGEQMLSTLEGLMGGADPSKSPFLAPAISTYSAGMGGLDPSKVPYLAPALDTLKYGMGAYDIAQNPYVKSVAEGAIRPVFQELTENVLPQIRGGATASGQYGGTRQGLGEALATRGAVQSALDTTSNIYGRAYETGLGTSMNAANQYSNLYNQGLVGALASAGGLENLLQQGRSTALQAAGAVPTAQTALTYPGTVLSGVGAQERALEQARINEEIARYEYEQMAPRTALAEYAKLIGTPVGGVSTSEVQGAGTPASQQIAGLSLALLPYIFRLFGIGG